jgi:hypothetical protein
LKKNDDKKVEASTRMLDELDEEGKSVRKEALAVIKKADPAADTNDTNYIFLNFVLNYLPRGLIGLLIAVVFCASWNSTARN